MGWLVTTLRRILGRDEYSYSGLCLGPAKMVRKLEPYRPFVPGPHPFADKVGDVALRLKNDITSLRT